MRVFDRRFDANGLGAENPERQNVDPVPDATSAQYDDEAVRFDSGILEYRCLFPDGGKCFAACQDRRVVADCRSVPVGQKTGKDQASDIVFHGSFRPVMGLVWIRP